MPPVLAKGRPTCGFPLVCASIRMEQERVMFARRHILVAAMSASVGLLSFTHDSYAASPMAKYAFSASQERGYPVERSACRCAPRPRPGLQPDYQFYYDTPGYFPGFYPGAGIAPELGPSFGSGFSEGPLGVH
jgi:hypothetical protein